MENLWTWGGSYFGYKEGNALWDKHGKHVGMFHGNEIYDSAGKYIGELMNGRLIYSWQKSNLRGRAFNPYLSKVASVSQGNYVGYVMYVGYEDFKYPR